MRSMTKNGKMRVWVYTGVLCAMIFPAVPPAAHAQTPATRTINGFSLSGRFLEEWSRQGSDTLSVYINGLPITPARSEISVEDGRAYETQWFERARYEMHPENPRPNDVLLGRLGASDAEGRGKVDPATGKAASPADQPFVGIDKPPDAGSAQKWWFPETRHTLSGTLLEYWQRYGGLAQFGYPLSEPFEETSRADGKRYTVQYFERARMEMHPEKPAPYNVELGLLGVEQHRMTPIAGDDLPVAPPKGVTTTREIVRIAMSAEPPDLTFVTASNTGVAQRIRTLIDDGLVGRDENENLFPLNAWYVPTLENGGARFVGESEDRYLQVKYKLRQGIKWSDGKELTSSDAVIAYRLMLDPRMPIQDRSEYLRLHSMDNPDKQTVIYSYKSYRQVLAFYNSLPDKENYSYLRTLIDAKKPVTSRLYSQIGTILPEHIWGWVSPDTILRSAYRHAPVTTGPWKVERWTTGQEIILVPNEYYTLTARSLIKRIEIKFVFNEGSLPFPQYYMTGNIDLFTSEGIVTPPANTAGIEAAGGRIVSRPSPTWERLDFVMDYAPFKEKAVREAIITAINRQRVAEVAFRGSGSVMNSVMPPSISFSLDNPDFARNYPDIAARYKLPIYDYNPARANQLLDQAGWVRGADGIRAKGGVKIQFEYATTINAVRQQTQSLVVADLRAVGIDAQQKAYPAAVFFGVPGPRSDGTTKLAQFAWFTTEMHDFGVWVCPDLYGPVGGPVLDCPQRYHHPRVEELNNIFDTSWGTEMVEAAAEAQVVLMQDLPTIPLVQRHNIEVVTTRLHNYKLPSGPNTSFWNARQWYFR